ncbi:MAG: DUF4192 domain-containing protein [Pseudonocardiaceae bacterium]
MTQDKTTHDKVRIRLRKPADLLAAIPQLLGFRPVNSVVLLADSGNGTKEVGRRLRCDLPPDHAVGPVAEQLIDSITQDKPPSVVIVIIGNGGDDEGRRPLPHDEFVRALRRGLASRGVDMPVAVWVPEIRAGSRWRCYDHERCGGVLPDPQSTVAAAESVKLGIVTYNSREELEQLFAPEADQLLRVRAQLIDAKFRDLESGAARRWSPDRGMAAVRAGLKAAHSGLLALSDDQLAELATALSDVQVRDACLATALPTDADEARAAERLWQTLARALPAPERAEAACLAGHAAYLAGNGAVAGIALQCALAADPSHVLSGLLIRALQAGIEPGRLHGLAEHAGETGVWPEPAAREQREKTA